jgi:hypothetical protein
VFESRRPTVREVAAAVDSVFREGLDIPMLSSWLDLLRDELQSFEPESDLVCVLSLISHGVMLHDIF